MAVNDAVVEQERMRRDSFRDEIGITRDANFASCLKGEKPDIGG